SATACHWEVAGNNHRKRSLTRTSRRAVEAKLHGFLYPHSAVNRKKKIYAYNRNERRNANLLQRLGIWAADCLLSRLAALSRRLGHAHALLSQPRLSRHCPRPARTWPVLPKRCWP